MFNRKNSLTVNDNLLAAECPGKVLENIRKTSAEAGKSLYNM